MEIKQEFQIEKFDKDYGIWNGNLELIESKIDNNNMGNIHFFLEK